MSWRRWRPALLKVHRWLGLTAGLLLMLNALTGSLMLGGRPLDRVLNAHLFAVPVGGETVPLEDVRQSLVKEFGSQASFTLRPPWRADESILVYVRSDNWAGQAYFDPYTGTRLGARAEHEGFANALFEFHSALLLGDTGKGVLAFNVLIMLAMLVTGLLLWWPRRWRGALSISVKGGLLRGLFDLHRVGGVILGLWIMVCVATGAWMAWRPISQWVTQVAGQKPVMAPPVKPAPPARAATADEMIAAANAALPGGIVGYLGLPAKPAAAVRVRKKLDDDPHPNGLSSVWLHPRTGEVLRVDHWTQLDMGARLYAWIYPLHAGLLAGVVGLVATAAAGAILFGFGLSGTWLWWLRRRMRLPRPIP
ncbi:PepSY-associated TM helix domain-containing protein [Polaromonas sp. UC242_47]|uniref:PepSY-associated TM helix domain-containing protein n=1 Tax=Polaromonas sp. UC242_47 TaxID=3374626 RepID=UPI0037AE1985